MRFGLLGPVQLRTVERQVAIHSGQQRALLAALLLQANNVVATDRLSELLWDAARPKQSRNTLQVQVSRLRRLVAAGDAGHERLTYRPPGYRLRVEPGELDLTEFQRLADLGRRALLSGDARQAGRLLRDALSIWRGRALEDVDAPAFAQQRARLEQRRLAVLEDRVDADLRSGRHMELMAELEALAVEHPLRERLWEQWMLTLYRGGRRADALAAYGTLRERLVGELGIEPSAPMQELQRRILRSEPAPEDPATPVAAVAAVPRQLPLGIADFTYRDRELAWLEGTLGRAEHSGPVVVAAIRGVAGVGKSALAIHLAHRLVDRFPDGQLYADLKGATAGVAPLAPGEVLGRFLRALGVDAGQVPSDLDEAAAQFRSVAAGRRLLIVLDNARDSAQVRPLLPSSPGSAALITSRRMVTAVDGASHLRLDVFQPSEAVELLGRLAGADRVAAEPAAGATLARWCGHLPLALRIAGSRLASRPAWTVGALVERLAAERDRLDELRLAEVGVRASFEVSYQELTGADDPLDQAAARAFALLGVPDGPDVGIVTAARLLDESQAATERVLERLVDAQLLESPGAGRYRMHDLLRVYARELAAVRCSPEERAAALERTVRFYVATAWRAMALLCPGDRRLERADPDWVGGGAEPPDTAAALTWLEAERANLLAAGEQACVTAGIPPRAPIQLAHALYGFLQMRGHWADWLRLNRLAHAVAERAGDLAAQAHTIGDLGIAAWRLGDDGEALACQRRSLDLYRQLGDRYGQAASLTNLGIVHARQGDHDQAVACFAESLAIDREQSDRHGQAVGLTNLGMSFVHMTRYEEALASLRDSVAIAVELGDRDGQAISLGNLGTAYLRLGREREALHCLEESLGICRELGNRRTKAAVLTTMGALRRRRGQHDRALESLHESLDLRQALGDRHGQAESLRALGETLLELGEHAAGRERLCQALAIFEQLRGTEADSVRVLLGDQPRAP